MNSSRKFVVLAIYFLYNVSFKNSDHWLALAQNNPASTNLAKSGSQIGSSSSASLSSSKTPSQPSKNPKLTPLATQPATPNDSKSSTGNLKAGGLSSGQSKPSATPVKTASGSLPSPVIQPPNQPKQTSAANQQPKPLTQLSSGTSYGASSPKPAGQLANGTAFGTPSQGTSKQLSGSGALTSGRQVNQSGGQGSTAKPAGQATSFGTQPAKPAAGSLSNSVGGGTPQSNGQASTTPASLTARQSGGAQGAGSTPRSNLSGQAARTGSGTSTNPGQAKGSSSFTGTIDNQKSTGQTSGATGSAKQSVGQPAKTPSQQVSTQGGSQPVKPTSDAQGTPPKSSLSPKPSPDQPSQSIGTKPAGQTAGNSTKPKPVPQTGGTTGGTQPKTQGTGSSSPANQPPQPVKSTTPSSGQGSAKPGKQSGESQDSTAKTPPSGKTADVTGKTGQAPKATTPTGGQGVGSTSGQGAGQTPPKPSIPSKAGGQPTSGAGAAIASPSTPAGQPDGGTSAPAGGQAGPTSSTPPPIPRRYGDPKTGPDPTLALFSRSRSRSRAGGKSTITGGVSAGSDDSENLTQTQLNMEKWARPTSLLKPGLHPMNKLALNLEISTIDPNDSTKKLVNDTNCYKISHEKGKTLYKFNKDTKCVLIKCDDKDVWKHVQGKGKEEQGAYPKYLVIVSKFIFMVFENYFNLYKKVSGVWKKLYDSMPTLEHVDIRHTNKKFYDYSKDNKNNVYTYTAKDGVLFNSVKKGKSSCGSELAIWDTTFPEEYATRIIRKGSGKKDKYLCVYYLSGNYSVFFKGKGTKKWEDKTSDKFFPTDFRFYTFNEKEKQYEDMDQSKVEVNRDDLLIRYKFADAAKCHGIRCGNIKLWNHDKNKFGEDYPHEMTLNMLNNEVTLKLKGLVFVYEYTGGDLAWKLSPPSLSSYFSSSLTVVTVDEKGSNSSENDKSRYEFNDHKTGLTYKIKEKSKFLEVKYGAKTLWKHGGKSQHPTVLYYDTKNGTLFLKFNGSLGICNSGDSRYVKVGDKAPNTGDLSLVTIDENNNLNETKIVDASDTPGDGTSEQKQSQPFTKERMDQAGKIFRYRFGDKVKFVELKSSGKSLWNHQVNKHGREFPSEIVFNLEMSTITINFDSYLYYLFIFDGEKWVLESENNMFDFFLGKFSIVTADDWEGTNSRENDELEISTERQNSFFLLFLADDSKCIQVKYEDKVLWLFNQKLPDSFARSVSCSPRLGSLAIDTDIGSLTFRMENGRWKQGYDPLNPLDPSEHPEGFTVITLDGETRVENDVSQYSVYDRRNDYFLYHFHDGVKCVEFIFGERKIWSHRLRHKKNYPESITVDFASNSVEVEIGDKTHTYPLFKDE